MFPSGKGKLPERRPASTSEVSLLALVSTPAALTEVLEYLETARAQAFAKFTDLSQQAVFDATKMDAAKVQYGIHKGICEIYDNLVLARKNNGKL